MKLFEIYVNNGTYFDNIEKIQGTPTGFSYFLGEKGLALQGAAGDDVTFAQTLTGVKTIVFAVKKVLDSKIFVDNITDKLEISGGNIVATGLTQNYVDNLDTDAVGSNQYHLVIAEFGGGIDFATNIMIEPSSLIYLGYKIIFYDSLLSLIERTDLLREFNSTWAKDVTLRRRYGAWNKPTDLSLITDLVAAFTFVRSGTVFTDVSGNGHSITINKALMTRDGANLWDHETIGDLGNVKRVAFRIKLNSTTEAILEGDPNAHLIHAVAGTLTYPDFDDAYVDGINTDTVSAGIWHNIVVTSSTDVNMTDVELCLNNVTVGRFEIEDLRFYDTEGTHFDAIDYHNLFADRFILKDDFFFQGVGRHPRDFKTTSGSFQISEDATSKHIDCIGTGILSTIVNLDDYGGNGFIKTLTGDLSADEDSYIDVATNLSYTGNKLDIAMTIGEKIRGITIIQGATYKAISPGLVPGVDFWFDGQNAASFTLDGTSVDQWDDLSVNGRHISNIGGGIRRPTYDVVTGGVSFSSANQTYLQCTAATFGAAMVQPNTIYVVYKITAGLGFVRVIFDGDNAINRHVFETTAGNFEFYAGIIIVDGIANLNNNIHIGEFNSPNSNYWINGILVAGPGNSGNMNLDSITLGANRTTAFNMDAEIREVFGFNRSLVISEHRNLHDYVNNKWSLGWPNPW